MTRDERGRYVTVPVSWVGLTGMWSCSVALLGWATFDGPEVLAEWSLLTALAAASWTILYGLSRRRDVILAAFDVGREVGHDDESVQRIH